MDDKRALFLTPEAPYPLAGGGALRTASLLHYLAARYTVDVIVFRQPGDPDPGPELPPGLAERVSVIELPAHRRGGFARQRRNTLRLLRRVPPLVDRFAGFESEILAAIGNEQYELGVIEHSWCAPYAKCLAQACRRTVLDLHNVESVLHARCADAGQGPTALAHRMFAAASHRLERRWFSGFSKILCTSEADATLVAMLAPETRVAVYPNAIPHAPVPQVPRDHAIVFSGNLEYHPNLSAVQFFHREVWPALKQQWPGLVWRLVGKNPNSLKNLIQGDSSIQVIGPVTNALIELARSQVAIVPILAGSGTRVKILEAWGAELPVVSTRLGAEGLPVIDGRHLLLADGPGAFASAVSRLLASPGLREQLGRGGRELLDSAFTWPKVWENLDL